MWRWSSAERLVTLDLGLVLQARQHQQMFPDSHAHIRKRNWECLLLLLLRWQERWYRKLILQTCWTDLHTRTRNHKSWRHSSESEVPAEKNSCIGAGHHIVMSCDMSLERPLQGLQLCCLKLLDQS